MFLWGKCKELQRKGWVNQVFCLGAVITVRITENGPTNNILHKKSLDGTPGMSQRICVKDYIFIEFIVNFRFYSADLCLLPAPFSWISSLCFWYYYQLTYFLSTLTFSLTFFTRAVNATWSAYDLDFFSAFDLSYLK